MAGMPLRDFEAAVRVAGMSNGNAAIAVYTCATAVNISVIDFCTRAIANEICAADLCTRAADLGTRAVGLCMRAVAVYMRAVAVD